MWGLLDQKGREPTPIKYDSYLRFKLDVTLVRANGKYGIVNPLGQEIAACVYDEITFDEYKYDKILQLKKEGFHGLMTTSGKLIAPLVYEKLIRLDQSYDNEKKWYLATYKGRQGLLDAVGKTALPCIYEQLTFIKDKLIIAKKDGFYGVITFSGKVVIPNKYDQIRAMENYYDDKLHYTYAVIYRGKIGEIDQSGRILIPCIFQNISFSYDQKLIPAKKDELYGLINRSGKLVTEFKYDNIVLMTTNYMTRLKSKAGVLSVHGNEITAPVYDAIEGPYYKMYIIKQGNKYGLLTDKGTLLCKPVYDSYFFCNDKYIIVTRDKRAGLLDISGKEIYPCTYAQIECVKDGIVKY